MLKNKKNSAAAPNGKRVYAVGDIHGCAGLLDKLMDIIAEDAAEAEAARIVFLGDYVDRGPDSKGVIDRLLEIQESRPDTVFLKGNHEALLLDFLSDPEDMFHWLDWGGEETLHSYGLEDILARAPEELGAEFAKALPAEHENFLKSLPLTHIEGDYLFVHAGLRPGVALEDQDEEDMLWIRKRFQNAVRSERPPYTIIHGHQPVKAPVDKGWRVDVDTGACWSGKLTAVVLENKSRRFLST